MRKKLLNGLVMTISEKYLELSEKELLEKIVELEGKNEYEQALKYVEKVLKQNPLSYHALFLKYRINEKLGKPYIIDLRLAYEEAKKQYASKEVLELMEDELEDFNYATEMINKPIKDYGTPSLTNEFFETNKIEIFSAASIGYDMLLNPEIESKTIKKIYQNLPQPRKELVDTERNVILSTESPEKLLQIMMKGTDTLNENVMMEKLLEFEEWTIPKLIDILKSNTNDFLVESIIKFIYHSKNDNTKLLLSALPSIKVAYNFSMTCMLLGLIRNKDAIKPLWDCYHFLKEEYPNKKYNQGPLLALFELKEKWKL